MRADGLIAIEIVYATTQAQDVVSLTVPLGTTVGEAITLSGLVSRYPDIDSGRAGIFGRIVPAATTLSEGDRIELYRPLIADPKQMRQRRARASGRSTTSC